MEMILLKPHYSRVVLEIRSEKGMRVFGDLLCTIPMKVNIAIMKHIMDTPAFISSLLHCGIAMHFGEDFSMSSFRAAL